MSEDEFWQATPVYFAARVEAYTKHRQNAIEDARFAAWLIVGPQLKNPVRLTKFYPLPWEEESIPQFAPIDPDVIRKFNEEADRILETHFNKPKPEA